METGTIYPNRVDIKQVKRDLAFKDKFCYEAGRLAIVALYVIAAIALFVFAGKGIHSSSWGGQFIAAFSIPAAVLTLDGGLIHARFLYSQEFIDYSKEEVAEQVLLDLANYPNLKIIAKYHNPLELSRYKFVSPEGCNVLKNISIFFKKEDTEETIKAKTVELQKAYFRVHA